VLATLAHKIALDPTVVQANYFARACGVARFTWNWALAKWNEMYAVGEKPDAAKVRKLFNSIKAELFPWIYEIHKDANQRVFTDLHDAFRRFFEKTAAHPVFKRKWQRDSCYVSNDHFAINGDRVRLPIVGWVRMHEELRFDGKIMSATISREADRWFLSVTVQHLDMRSVTEAIGNGIIGVDLGISALATLSSGEVIEGPKPLKAALKQLQLAGRSLSRKVKGSSNWKKAVVVLQCIHARITHIRKDFIHKLTTRLCRENQTVVIEDLRMAFMLKNRHLSRAASDMGLSEFRRQMKYKTLLFGTELIIADQFFPSTRICSKCGALKDMLLSERTYRCDACGLVLSRDHNAAINLEQLGYPRPAGFSTCGQEGAGPPITGRRNHAWMKQEPAGHMENA
jgi:putative transposase